MTSKEILTGSAGILLGALFMAISAEIKTNRIENPIDCTEHVLIDGMHYCGVYIKNGIKYEVTMKDVANSVEVLSADFD